MDQCIAKPVLHVYTLDTCCILFHNSADRVMNSQVSGQCSHAMHTRVSSNPFNNTTLTCCPKMLIAFMSRGFCNNDANGLEAAGLGAAVAGFVSLSGGCWDT